MDVGVCIPLGAPTLSLWFIAHLLFELGFLIDKVFFSTPVVVTVLLELVICASDGGCVGVNVYNCRTVDGRGGEVWRVVNALQWSLFVNNGTINGTVGRLLSLAQVRAGPVRWCFEIGK